MEMEKTCKQTLSEAVEIAKHTIWNMYKDLDADDKMSHDQSETLYHCVMTIIEVHKAVGESIS